MKKIFVCLSVFVLLLTGCAAHKQDEGLNDSDAYRAVNMDSSSKVGLGKNDASYEITEDSGLKIVYGGSLDLETREYDKAMETLYQYVYRYKMVIEKMEESYSGINRNLSVTMRIPSVSFAEFMKEAANIGKVNHSSTNRSDFTKAYNDNTIEIEALEVQKERLMKMLKEADNVEDMLLVSDRLTEIEASLNKLKSHNANIDMDVEYSSISLYLRERGESTVQSGSFWQRLKDTISDSFHSLTDNLEGFIFWLVYALPYLVIITLVAVFASKKITPAIKRRKAARKNPETN